MKLNLITVLLIALLIFSHACLAVGNLAAPPDSSVKPQTESDYYRLLTLPIPDGVVLEAGGIGFLDDGRLAVASRRGELWLIENPYMREGTNPFFKRYAQGLYEPLGLKYKDGSFYLAQRGEMTKLTDKNGDDKADVYESIYKWPLSGNYHEFSYGPAIHPDGSMYATLNVGFFEPDIFRPESEVKWRGWLVKIKDGKLTPVAAGLRSPAGVGLVNGDVFYSENQGDWAGSGGITHLESGDFAGNPASLKWTYLPESPIKGLKRDDIPDSGKPMFEVAKAIPALKTPSVWFPYGIMGTSTSDILQNTTKGAFGPFFDDQVFVGDQGQSKIMRVFLEKVDGKYQGACFPFREGFSSGVLRMAWGHDGSLFAGMTNRGWSSVGPDLFGLQRLVWTGKTPFEVKAIRAKADGFELEFTLPINQKTAEDIASYKITSFIYQYHHNYGSPVINEQSCPIKGVVVSSDGLKARLVVDGLREGYINEIKSEGIRSQNNNPLLHSVAYYTLNKIPSGDKITLSKEAVSHEHAIAADKKNVTAKTKIKEPAANSMKRQLQMPASWNKGTDQVITIGTNPGLKFNPVQIEVKAGNKIKLTFANNDDMLHNCVFVLPGEAVAVGDLAVKLGLEGTAKSYIPETNKVLFYTKLLQPHSSETIYFTAPSTPGDYTYVCTVPGHYFVMQGTMKVSAK